MKPINSLFLMVTMFINMSLSAQWINIPNPGVPTTIALPVGNNKIIYAGSFQNSPSGGGYVVAHRADDFGTKVRVYYETGGIGTHPYMYDAAYYNDSTICLLYNTYTYGIGYTANNFKNTSFKTVGGSGSYSMFNTSKHLFVLSPMLSYTLDTLMLKRVNTNGSEDTVIFLPKYYSGYVKPFQPKISFINDSTGFILARYKSNTSKSVLLKTIDYGDHWNELLIDSINLIGSYSFPSAQVGYVHKANLNIFKTIDGGATWQGVGNSTIPLAFSMAFSDDNIGYVGGANGTLSRTTNGGMSWSTETSGTTANITGIFTFGPVVYFRTAGNAVFKNYPKGVNVSEYENTLQDVKIYPNPFQGHLTLEAKKENSSKTVISVTNLIGQEVYTTEDVSGNLYISKNLDLSFLNPGIYFVSMRNANLTYSQKVILNK